MARGVCSGAGGAQGDRSGGVTASRGQRAGPGQNPAKGKWTESPDGTYAAAPHPSESPAGPVQTELVRAPRRAPGAWESRVARAVLHARGAGVGQSGITGSQLPALPAAGAAEPCGKALAGPRGMRHGSGGELEKFLAPAAGDTVSPPGTQRGWESQAMGPGHRRMLLQPHCLAEMGRTDGRTDGSCRAAAARVPCAAGAGPLRAPSCPCCAAPALGAILGRPQLWKSRSKPGNRPSPRVSHQGISPGNAGPSRQGISPSPTSPCRLPK